MLKKNKKKPRKKKKFHVMGPWCEIVDNHFQQTESDEASHHKCTPTATVLYLEKV